MPKISECVASVDTSPLARWAHLEPWQVTSQAQAIVEHVLGSLAAAEYRISSGIAIHASAVVEDGATLKPPLVLARGVFVASGADQRGGCWLAEGCRVGPSVELKSTFVFAGSTLAHLNFIGDSIVGARVNVEAGAVVCNFRNERPEQPPADAIKFGALVGDGSRIGANAVLAPGTILMPNSIVGRLELVDQLRTAAQALPSARRPSKRTNRNS